MTDMSLEQILVELQKRWQDVLFRQFYSRTSGLLIAYLRKRISSAQAAEEVAQIVYMQIYRKIDQYDSQYKALQWLYVIAQSESRDYLLKERRHVLNRDSNVNFESLSQTPDTSPIIKQVDISGLSPDQRAVLEGRFYEDLEFEEIAERLGKSPVNVRKILSRGLEILRLKNANKPKGG